MNESLKKLKGSAYRDAVRLWHKQIDDSEWFYASDEDLVFISFEKGPIAALDIKTPQDDTTATEEVLYKYREEEGVPVYRITCLDYLADKCAFCGKRDVEIKEDTRVQLKRLSTGEEKTFDNAKEYRVWEADLRRQAEGIAFREKYSDAYTFTEKSGAKTVTNTRDADADECIETGCEVHDIPF